MLSYIGVYLVWMNQIWLARYSQNVMLQHIWFHAMSEVLMGETNRNQCTHSSSVPRLDSIMVIFAKWTTPGAWLFDTNGRTDDGEFNSSPSSLRGAGNKNLFNTERGGIKLFHAVQNNNTEHHESVAQTLGYSYDKKLGDMPSLPTVKLGLEPTWVRA